MALGKFGWVCLAIVLLCAVLQPADAIEDGSRGTGVVDESVASDVIGQQMLQGPSVIPEFHQVTGQIYRGGRPGSQGLDQVKRLGVRTIIDLENDSQAMQLERQYAARIGLGWISEPMSAGVTPDDREVSQILSLLQDARRFPIFIHCKHGQDRTGLIIGLYRVFVQRWTPSQAYQEMLQYGFHPQYQALDQYFRSKTGSRGRISYEDDPQFQNEADAAFLELESQAP